MTNAEKFKVVFGIYATELWAMPEEKFLEWLNAKTEPHDCNKCKWWEADTRFCYSIADSDDHSCHYEPQTERSE